ncbi:hypothetical protein ANCCAN_20969 [Ancylostoma caninum]|uniref:Uncharacterized protein n=1 Tax=Ancylostoma caninum TaxID=29170 RepID=A0A368FLV2_ANCCA|nr:hypothetical protein ANCCAN_20969 [Ancylostoma caninum]
MMRFLVLAVFHVTIWLDGIFASIRPYTELTHHCHHLPVSGFLTSQQLDLICHHREQWMKDRDALSAKSVVQEATVDQLKYLRDLEDCTRHNCIEVARSRRRRKVTGHVLLVTGLGSSR